MLPDHFHIQQGRTLPIIQATITDEDGDVVNLTGGTAVFYMKAQDDGAMKINGDAAVVSVPASGVVTFTFTAANTNEPGDYWAWFVVTLASGVLAAPNPQYVVVHVTPAT